MTLQKLLTGAAIVAVALPAAAYGTRATSSGEDVQKLADLYQINQIEARWHRATSAKRLNLMMSLWAPHAVWTVGPTTYQGKSQIRAVFRKAGPYQPQNHWISDAPAYKTRAAVHGNKGTLYFECHYVDVDTGKVVLLAGQNTDLEKIDGKWLIVHMTTASPTLTP